MSPLPTAFIGLIGDVGGATPWRWWFDVRLCRAKCSYEQNHLRSAIKMTDLRPAVKLPVCWTLLRRQP